MKEIDSNSTLLDLVYSINPDKADKCAEVDLYLPEKLDWETLGLVTYHLGYSVLPNLMPSTRIKINQIISEALAKDFNSWYFLKTFSNWLSHDVVKLSIKKWIESEDNEASWVINNLSNATDMTEEVLNKMVKVYASNKSKYHVKNIERIFKNIPSDKINNACKILSESSPAVSACLLSREDIPEEYIIVGLKSISKLSRQRNILVDVDFQALKSLGPKSRLDAMKQLLGMMDKYRANGFEFPFKTTPTREEVEQFLFPCSMKYTEEVSLIVKKYEELVNKTKSKEVIYG